MRVRITVLWQVGERKYLILPFWNSTVIFIYLYQINIQEVSTLEHKLLHFFLAYILILSNQIRSDQPSSDSERATSIKWHFYRYNLGRPLSLWPLPEALENQGAAGNSGRPWGHIFHWRSMTLDATRDSVIIIYSYSQPSSNLPTSMKYEFFITI